MSNITQTAELFFDACETGKGWDACKAYCHPNATFSAQAGALSDIGDVESYTAWMQWLLTAVPDGHYELKSFSTDEKRNCVTAFGVLHGTQTGPSKPNIVVFREYMAIRWVTHAIRHTV